MDGGKRRHENDNVYEEGMRSVTMSPVIKRSFTTLCAAATIAIAMLAGCSSAPEATQSTPGTQTATTTEALPPIMKEPAALDGSTVKVPIKRELVLVVPEGDDAAAWTGALDDETIAEFVPGTNDGSATHNPGVHPLAEGETTVTLTDPTGQTISFTLIIVPGAR